MDVEFKPFSYCCPTQALLRVEANLFVQLFLHENLFILLCQQKCDKYLLSLFLENAKYYEIFLSQPQPILCPDSFRIFLPTLSAIICFIYSSLVNLLPFENGMQHFWAILVEIELISLELLQNAVLSIYVHSSRVSYTSIRNFGLVVGSMFSLRDIAICKLNMDKIACSLKRRQRKMGQMQ